MEQEPKPKSKMMMIIIAVVVIAVAVGAYLFLRGSSNDKESSGTDANEIADTASWPAGLPVTVPKYTMGSISDVATLANPKTWDISVTKTKKTDYEKYVADVTAAGWTKKSDGGTIGDYVQMQKENWTLMIVFEASTNGVKINLAQSK